MKPRSDPGTDHRCRELADPGRLDQRRIAKRVVLGQLAFEIANRPTVDTSLRAQASDRSRYHRTLES